MRVVIQRVSSASVSIEGRVVSVIQKGLLVLACWEEADTWDDLNWMAAKICRLRIFNGAEGKMNLSLADVNGSLLLVSQFTLYASSLKGNRPSYIRSARPETAINMYEKFRELLAKESGTVIQCGEFGASMQVALVNDGPVTITIDTRNKE